MNQEQYKESVAKLETAITDEAGELRPITRIELEPIGRQVRWTIWEGDRRLHTSTGSAGDVAGFLSATKMILDLLAEDNPPQRREEHREEVDRG